MEDIRKPNSKMDSLTYENWKGMGLPSSRIFPWKNQSVQEWSSRGLTDDHQSIDILKQSKCSFSVYKQILSILKIHNVECENSVRAKKLKFMSEQLGNMEKLSADVEDFIQNETGFQRLARFMRRDPHTGEFPGYYVPLMKSGFHVIGIVGVFGFFTSIYKFNNQFKKMNPYTYEQRKFQKERLFPLISSGAKGGTHSAFFCARLFAPFYVISIGLSIFLNNTNPVSTVLGITIAVLLNKNLIVEDISIRKILIRGNIFGLFFGTGLYFYLKSINQTQDIINRDSVRTLIYNSRPSSYED